MNYKEKQLAEMLRVNHAGEYGARRIYQGQLAVLKRRKSQYVADIEHMKQQEEEHLSVFEQELRDRKIRPSILSPFWHVAGFALGAGAAILGDKAAFACTVAVEHEIDKHYQEQEAILAHEYPEEQNLADNIAKFRAQEMEHHDLAIEKDAEKTPMYGLLSGAIKCSTKLAIEIAKKL